MSKNWNRTSPRWATPASPSTTTTPTPPRRRCGTGRRTWAAGEPQRRARSPFRGAGRAAGRHAQGGGRRAYRRGPAGVDLHRQRPADHGRPGRDRRGAGPQGGKVTVTLPDGGTTKGTVTDVGTVAHKPAGQTTSGTGQSTSSGNDTATIDVTVTLDDPAAGGNLDAAPVDVAFVDAARGGAGRPVRQRPGRGQWPGRRGGHERGGAEVVSERQRANHGLSAVRERRLRAEREEAS